MLYWNYTASSNWLPSLRNLFFSYIHDQIPQFYLTMGRNMYLFHKKKGESCVYLSNSTLRYREVLHQNGIEASILNDDREKHTQELLKFHNSSNSYVVVKHVLKEPNLLAEIKGTSIHLLYNFLQNQEGEITLISQDPFIGATLQCINTMENTEIKILSDFSQKAYSKNFRLKLSGSIMPSAIRTIATLLEKQKFKDFEMKCQTDPKSRQFSTHYSKIMFEDGGYSVL